MLTGCSGGSGDLPPERPKGRINGYAIDSAISNGTVSVYSFANGVRGQKLGSGVTDNTGAFSVQIQAASQVVLVEITGGSYFEEASGKQVSLMDGQSLSSLVQYQSGHAVSTNITPLTHMATALAQFKIAQGAPAGQAITESFGVIDDFFGVNSRDVTSFNITKGTLDQTTLDPDVLYGFYMAGLSSWTAWINQQNNHDAHSVYTSVGLVQLMYDDIRADGLLDGFILDNTGNNPLPLTLEKVSLNADAYRLAFSLHVIAAARGTQNKTGITSDNPDLMAAAQKLAGLDGTSPLLPDGTTALALGDQPISVSVDSTYYSGIFGAQYSFAVIVDSLVGAESITISMDQSDNIVQTLGPLDAPQARLDLSALPSGQHTVYVAAANIFGAASPPYSFNVTLDTEAPTVTFTSEPYTSATSIDITGTYQDTGGAGIQSVAVILGQNTTTATLDDPVPGQWKATVNGLVKGNNPLSVVVTDNVGNTYSTNQFQVYLDDLAPVIANADPQSTHSLAKFSSGGGNYTQQPLLTSDTAEALYIETNNSAFNSSADPVNLDNNGIPYFKFTISDDRAPSNPTNPQAIMVEMQYSKLDTSNQTHLIDGWHVLNRYQACDSQTSACEYYIPLAAPFLNSNWDQTTPLDTQIIDVRVTDPAGNQTTAQFSFRADFYTPQIPVCSNPSCTQGELVVTDLDPFTGADFAQRDTLLYNTALDTTTYTFTNPSSKSIYIKIAEPLNTEHVVTQTQEEYVRIHHIQHTKQTQWQVNFMNPLTTCPSPTASWYTVGVSVLLKNWDGNQWTNISPPGAQVDEYDWSSDTLPADTTQTSDATDPDTLFHHETALFRNFQYVYDADYEVDDLANNYLGYAYLANWSATNINSQNTTTCPDQRYFQEIVNDTYATLVAPHNVIQEISPSITAAFNTDIYKVLVDQVEVQPVSGGWYAIPAGANVDIVKVVRTSTTPPLVFKEDSFTGNAPYTAPFPTRDKMFTWSIDRNLNIYAIHNTGETNISAMSQRETLSSAGAKVYVNARP